jgi:hypothetical protein
VSVHIAPDSGGVVGPLLATARSDDAGEFVASFLRPGRYQLVAEDLARDAVSPPTVAEVKAGDHRGGSPRVLAAPADPHAHLGFSRHPSRRRVSVRAMMRQPSGVCATWKASIPQWLNSSPA